MCFGFDLESGQLVQVDEETARQSGLSESSLLSRSIYSVIDEPDLARVERAVAALAEAGQTGWFCHLRCDDHLSDFMFCDARLHSDGKTVYVAAHPAGFDAFIRGSLGVPASVTSSSAHNVEATPHLAEQVHHIVSDRLFEISVSHLVVLDRRGTVLLANPNFCSSSDIASDLVVGQPVQDVLKLVDSTALLEALWSLKPSGEVSGIIIESRGPSGNRVFRVRLVCSRDGSAVYFVGHDVTEERRLHEQLIDRATRDQLTRLANRESFNLELDRAIDSGDPVTLVMLDLDDFKRVNDTLGHSVGDELLAITGHRIGGVVRSDDLVARFGGDEFMVLLRGIGRVEEAERIAEKIRLALSLPCMISGRKLHVTSSIGVAIGEKSSHDAARLFHEADAAAYEAKRLGRNQWVVYDNKLDCALREQAEVESQLRHALAHGGIEPFVQGIQSIDGYLNGVEVLVRMRGADGTIFGPGYFLDVARQLGLLTKVGEQVYDAALRSLAPWLAANPSCTVSLNADPREIMAPGFVRILRRVITRHRVEPRQIYLEVTETGILASGGLGGQVIAELREMGLRIAIDDFGTGASSLGYLRDLMIDRIKIDRTFVTNLHLNPSRSIRPSWADCETFEVFQGNSVTWRSGLIDVNRILCAHGYRCFPSGRRNR